MAKTFVDKRQKWDRLTRQIKKIDGSGASVKIGVQQGEKHTNEESGETSDLVDIAAKHEFGDKDENIPQRSFIRTTTDEQRLKVNRKIQIAWGRIIEGRSTPERELGMIGQFMELKIRKKITDIKQPPNSPATIAMKGSSNPLIDTGQMRNSIRFVVEL